MKSLGPPVISPSLWLDVSWDTLQYLRTVFEQAESVARGSQLQNAAHIADEVLNLRNATEAQLQKRPRDTDISDLLV